MIEGQIISNELLCQYAGRQFHPIQLDQNVRSSPSCQRVVLQARNGINLLEVLTFRGRLYVLEQAVHLFAQRVTIHHPADDHEYKWTFDLPTAEEPSRIVLYCDMSGEERERLCVGGFLRLIE